LQQAALEYTTLIYGIGTDICDVRRIAQSLERHGDRFAQRILSAAEYQTYIARCDRSGARGVSFMATRFSAKEAFSKAIGLGMRMPMTWRLCEIASLPGGQPTVVLHGVLKAWFEARGLTAHVSLTDEAEYAASFVIIEKNTP
jgi:holo-[acyl-carrier-protein] synthase